MFFRARRTFHRAMFDRRCRSVLETKPLGINDHGVTLVSMVCHGEVLMYLLAVKSFCLQLGRVPNLVVLDDGSLTREDRSTICRHLHGVALFTFNDVPADRCPKGNCWERLLLISDLSACSYVIQLDCDTLTQGEITAIADAVRENRSFTLLGERSHGEVEAMADACARLKGQTSQQVQAVCERNFDKLADVSKLRYLRGNAGFTGFARGSLTREQIVAFSDRMRTIADGKWDDWGSEQLTSNLLIANSDRPVPLPFPAYASFWGRSDVAYKASSFLHFIGPFRYAQGLYMSQAKRVLRALLAENKASA